MNSADPPASRKTLAGLRILVLDDEPLVAMLTEDMLRDAKASDVVVASNEASAHNLLGRIDDIGAAVIDVNMSGQPSFAIARALRERGIPFVFATGYSDKGGVPDDLKDAPLVTKPFAPGMLVSMLLQAIAARR
jgi:CheY-like chemotaxis protein